jgi:hypothetical protein
MSLKELMETHTETSAGEEERIYYGFHVIDCSLGRKGGDRVEY